MGLHQPTEFHFPFMPCRERPAVRIVDMPMRHRIPMNMGDMGVKVLCVADHVFPVSPPPDIALAFAAVALLRHRKASAETGFQEPNARREVCVIVRQAPDEVRMFRLDDRGDRFKGMGLGDVRP